MFGRGRTLQKARLAQLAGRARDTARRGAARDRQQPASLPSLGRREKRVTQLQVKRSLRGKRSDPSHGANAQPKAVAVPVVKVPVRKILEGVPAPVRRANHRQMITEPGVEASLERFRSERVGTVPL